MEFTSGWFEIIPVEEPTMPPDFRSSDCISINFSCIKQLIQVTQPTNPTSEIDFSFSSTTFNHTFLVPSNILCNCTPLTDFNGENAELLHEIFSSVPISSELLDQVLPDLAEDARTILSHERCDLLKMDVNLRIFTVIADEDFDVDDDDHGQQNVSEIGQLMNLLERPKVDEEEDDVEQCAICLEEFSHGTEEDSSSGEVVRTNCSHVFHERCIFRWLERCIKCESPYSCPLCRCNVFPTSEEDE